MKCRVCDSAALEPVIDLGLHPWCNNFLRADQVGTEPVYPLRVIFCHSCATAQLDFTVKKEIMFGDHTYLSGVTHSLSDHFRQVARSVTTEFFPDRTSKSVLDIGSNDGTQLQHFRELGYDILGVESSKSTARIANERGIPTHNEFFNLDLAGRLGREFDVINASGVFFHLEELHSVTEGIRSLLKEDGVFVVQFLYMRSIVQNLAFDQIYHEHLLYYNLATIEKLLRFHGLSMFDAYLAPIHGGSIVGYVTHKGRRAPTTQLQAMRARENRDGNNEIGTYQRFAQRIEQMKEENLVYLWKCKGQSRRVFGMGAPVKGNTLLNYFRIGPDLIECLVERNTLRKGLFSPGMHLPIRIESELEEVPDVYYVLAWNFKQEILERNQHLIERGTEFFFPVNPAPVEA